MATAATERLERGVYRCSCVVRGMVTYFAVTAMGEILNDELRCVRPGTVSEALTATALRCALEAHDGHVRPRLPLRVFTSPSPSAPSTGFSSPQLVR